MSAAPIATADENPAPLRRRRWGLALGALGALALLALPAPEGMSAAAWRTVAVAALMAVWWATEAIPVAATALLPLVLFPALGIAGIEAAAAPFGNAVIFLFLGGFVLALAVERWLLHRRIALVLLLRIGHSPASVIAGLMLASAFISMWISNTATVMLLLPIATAVVAALAPGFDPAHPPAGPARDFAAALVLGVAYAATIGGVGTLIGTPPNALFSAFVADTQKAPIGFGEWMAVGVPVAAVMLAAAFLVLTRLVFPAARRVPWFRDGATLSGLAATLPPASAAEKRVAAIFLLAALLWVGRPLLVRAGLDGLTDAGIAVGCALLTFLVPAGSAPGRLMNWESLGRLPWGILILFGGGLSLADAFVDSGLAAWIGARTTGLGEVEPLAVMVAVAVVVVFLSELMSNTALAATFLPVAAAIATGLGASPIWLAVVVALGSSLAFMLPVGTPPNAIVYATGYLTMAQMIRAGLWLNAIGIAVAVAAAWWLAPLVLGYPRP